MSRFHVRLVLLLVGIILVTVACGDDDDSGGTYSTGDDVSSYCDEHGHRVYILDDVTPAMFVIPNDCEAG